MAQTAAPARCRPIKPKPSLQSRPTTKCRTRARRLVCTVRRPPSAPSAKTKVSTSGAALAPVQTQLKSFSSEPMGSDGTPNTVKPRAFVGPSAKFQSRYSSPLSPDEPGRAPSVEEFGCDKSIEPSTQLFQYLESFGRNTHPLITKLRRDTLIRRQHIIGMLLEPTTCALVDWQVKALGARRILEVGTFTGVTAMSLALSAQANDARLPPSSRPPADCGLIHGWDWLHGLTGGHGTGSLSTEPGVGVDSLSSPAVQKAILKQRQLESGTTKGKVDPNRALDLTTVTRKEMIVQDNVRVLDTLARNVEQWGQQGAQSADPTSVTTGPSALSNYSPPLVITVDRNTANIQEISYQHWDEAGLVGSPLVFIGGMATETLARMTRVDESVNTGAQLPSRSPVQTEPSLFRIDNGAADRIVTQPGSPVYGHLFRNTFDFIFVDADKRSYPIYYEQCLELLRPGGVACFDNVLWKGDVLQFLPQNSTSINADSVPFENSPATGMVQATAAAEQRSPLAASSALPTPKGPKQNLSVDLHEFNKAVHSDPRVEMILVPIGDGLTMVRKL